MFNLFKKRSAFDDEMKTQFVEAVALMLEVQLAAAGRNSVESSKGEIIPKALGYVYGFIDAALRTIGQDMSDPSVGPPVAFQVFRHAFPGARRNTRHTSPVMWEAMTLLCLGC